MEDQPKKRGRGRPKQYENREQYAEKPSDRFPLVMPSAKHHLKYKTHDGFKHARARFERARQREKAQAADRVFSIGGKMVTRYAIMETIIQLTYEGFSLPQILDAEAGDPEDILPTPAEVNRWFTIHPDFKASFVEAEKYRAEKLSSDAIEAVLYVGADKEKGATRDDIAHAKLIKDTLIEQAAFLNDKFQTKTKQQIENITDNMSESQLMERLAALLDANPDLKELFGSHQKQELPCTVVDADLE